MTARMTRHVGGPAINGNQSGGTVQIGPRLSDRSSSAMRRRWNTTQAKLSQHMTVPDMALGCGNFGAAETASFAVRLFASINAISAASARTA